jgi:hypothetical protein
LRWTVLAVSFCGQAFSQTIAVPNILPVLTSAGNRASGPLAAPGSPITIQFQIVINPDEFRNPCCGQTRVTGPVRITGFTFRARPGFGALSITGASSGGNPVQVFASTTPKSASPGPTFLSPTFADNLGADNTLVFSGSSVTVTAPGCAAPGPCPFGNNIVFTAPFDYNPNNGSLLLYVRYPSFFGTGQIDIEDCSPGGCGFADVVAPFGSASGGTEFGTDIIQLSFTSLSTTVPTLGPSGLLAVGLGLAAAGWWLSRQSRRQRPAATE